MGFSFGIWKVIRSLIVDGVPINVVSVNVLLNPFMGLEIVLWRHLLKVDEIPFW